ncbi:succinylglutamate desuccinylase/aspartoacylase family protein [Coraliomargarita sp. SDUM461003]|uniref:Succinylglutamate desuccinylase/aspartoacylase family protein n=1 Tax=Thalassobacterium maritimum TaxID=3041265 RepID=A0ABU1AZ31_9BACT|nr:succinylglutamate desuccinylase/aspartoacylase family protein [Coraliomargarita sp. SDUM461003]MDQ8208385.1 succinylglutamate desuccinylase/aspartoacylase family protein [Coraliomargarita sp. SDUM461003]
MPGPQPFLIAGERIRLGESKDVRLEISETYTGDKICIPLRVMRAMEPGPTIFITAAIHGDEVNGTGIIHDFLFGQTVDLKRGTLVLAPVINVFGFETHERYLPDRRDLNRSFPGSKNGSLASRIANTLMTELVDKCDYGIDLHTAAAQRTNFPNIRADLTDPAARRLAEAFGCVMVVDGKGPLGSFRRESTRRGCPTIILEAGEPCKVEPSVLQIGIQGIRNVLSSLGMIDEPQVRPPFLAKVRKMQWVRATVGGILKFHVSPGDFVEADQAVATNYSIMGVEQNVLRSPNHGIILGMATMPAVKPGEPICNVATLTAQQLKRYRAKLEQAKADPHAQAQSDLATSMDVVDASQSGA